eukprot:scaffold5802_cov173-Cylindrotheca_fusiformis.AAC.2
MKGVSSSCCLPHAQPLLTPSCLCVADSTPFVRLLRHGSLARALARIDCVDSRVARCRGAEGVPPGWVPLRLFDVSAPPQNVPVAKLSDSGQQRIRRKVHVMLFDPYDDYY